MTVKNKIVKKDGTPKWSKEGTLTEKLEVVEDINKRAEGNVETVDIESQEKGKGIEFLIFEIDNTLFGIETKFVSEILELQYITPVPLTKDFFLGLINLRNEIVSVIDLNKFITNRFTPYDEKNRMCILNFNNIQTSVIVNKIESISSIKEKNFITNIENVNLKYKEFLKGIVKVDEKDIPVIDVAKLFSSEEFKNVGK